MTPAGPAARLVAWWAGLPGNVRGAAWTLVNAVSYTGSVALIKELAGAVPVINIVFFSVACQFLFIGSRSIGRLSTAFQNRRHHLHFLRVALLLTSMLSGFYCVQVLPIANATAIGFTKAMFLVLLAAFLLREKVGSIRWLATLIGFAGVLVLVQPGSQSLDLGVAAGLLSAATAAGAAIATRILALREPPGVILLYQTVLATAVLAPFAAYNWVTPDWQALAFMVAIGLLGVAGNVVVILALRAAEASAVAPFEYSRAVLAFIVGLAVFDEVPTLAAIAGTLLIIAGSALSMRADFVAGRRGPPAPPSA